MLMPQEIVRLKRDGQELAAAQLQDFFYGYLAGGVADYQVSAMLMAILLRGMTSRETADLTCIMRDSGAVLTWPYPRSIVVDKHSTGGIGDKTSLVLLPLGILEGLRVPMMAGRGLGHTGGTLDKLEAVGWNVFPTVGEARAQVDALGGVIMGQTEQVTPLDRRLYAMRDVTATVESIPLIVGSILSKKLAAGIGGLVMDVKYGSGAFMMQREDALELAAELKAVGEECGLRVRCLITSMNSPLGRFAGNTLEVYECLQVLSGTGPADTRELVLALATEMVCLAFPERDAGEVRFRLEGHLQSGRAYELFLRLAAAQGGDVGLLAEPEKLLGARLRLAVVAPAGGHVQKVDVRKLGVAILELGGGRRLVTDKIDPWVGLSDMKHVGESVSPGEPLAIVHATDEQTGEVARALVASAYQVGDVSMEDPLIVGRM